MCGNHWRSFQTILILCISLILCLTGCSAEITKTEDASDSTYQTELPIVHEDTESMEAPVYPLNFSYVTSAHSAEEAMDRVQEILKAKDIGYQWEFRDSIYYQHEKRPAKWIYAVNQYHEFLDVIIMDDADLLEEFTASPEFDHFRNLRQNEGMSLQNSFSKPLDGVLCSGLASFCRSDDLNFGILLVGYAFAIKDVDGRDGYDVYSPKDRAYVYSGLHSREETLIQDDQLPPLAEGLKVFEPENSMKEAQESVLSCLQRADPSYRIENRDVILIDGEEYPAQWMYAVNDSGEFIDIVFTEDLDFLYYLHDNRDVFWKLREEDREYLYQKQPGRKQYEPTENQWLLIDLFYKGYGIYLYGCGCPAFDCGMVAPCIDWSEDLNHPTMYYSRQWVWGLNVTRED